MYIAPNRITFSADSASVQMLLISCEYTCQIPEQEPKLQHYAKVCGTVHIDTSSPTSGSRLGEQTSSSKVLSKRKHFLINKFKSHLAGSVKSNICLNKLVFQISIDSCRNSNNLQEGIAKVVRKIKAFM